MSLIQTIRDKASWLIVVVITLAIVGFIFMDAGNTGGLFGGGGGKSSVGSVNGKSIKTRDFEDRKQMLKDIYSDNPQATDEVLENYVWNNMVEERLMEEELNKLGGNLSEKELIDIAVGKYGQPNQHLQKKFGDPQSGQFNTQAAEQWLKRGVKMAADTEDGRDARSMLKMVRFEYLMGKHQQLMGNTVFLPAWMAKKQMEENNKMAKLSVVQVPYTEINDSIPELKISDDEIKKEMAKNPYLYKQEESRNIDYVMFAFTPTSADSAAVSQSLEEKKEAFKNVPDSMMGAFITNNNSRTPYSDIYVRKKEITIKGDSNATYTTGVVYGPYLDGSNYSIARVVSEKGIPDSVRCRHILVKMGDQQRGLVLEDSLAKKRIDSIKAAIDGGADFNALVLSSSDDEGSKNTKGEYTFQYSQVTGISKEFGDVIFYEPAGTKKIVKVINNSYAGYHYIEVLNHYATAPGYKMAYYSRPIIPSETTRDSARALAESFAANNRDAKSFDDYIVKNPGKVVKLGPMEVGRADSKIMGFDQDNVRNSIIKWIYGAKPGQVSEAMVLEQSYRFAVVKLNGITPQGTTPVAKARPQIEAQMRLDRKYDMLVKKYGRPASIQEAATKTGKQVITADSVSFENGGITGLATELRVAGMMLNQAVKGKVSGPVKGSMGLYYMQVEGEPYNKPAAQTDAATYRATLQQQQKRGAFSGSQGFRKSATIKDKRLD